MQKGIKYCCCLLLVLFTKSVFAQQSFYIDNTVAKSISAATYDHAQKAVMFFAGNTVFYYPLASEKTVSPEWFTLEGIKKVDAAVDWDDDHSLFFDGATYRMFQHSTGQFVTDYIQWPGLPASWENKLDGAVKWDNDLIVFFYNDEYVMYSIASKKITGQDKVTNWNGWPTEWSNGIDDAFTPGDGYIYFVRAGDIMAYSIADKNFSGPQKMLAYNSTPASVMPPVSTPSSMPGMKSTVTSQNNYSVVPTSITTTPENNPGDLSGCITGAPAGSGLRETQSPVEGDQQGGLSYDNLPKGYHIAELKIFTSKIWGKSVISGIQTIVKSASGQRQEQPVLGRKTVTENSFLLDDDECISGINGTKNGASGNFIYSLQIITSKRSSQVYGERAAEPSRQPFNLRMPADAVFNGFAGSFNNNMTGIGIKYFGQQEIANTSTESNTATYTSNNSTASITVSNTDREVSGEIKSASHSSGENTSTTVGTPGPDGYIDNYTDYTASLGADYEFSLKTMPGIEWLGAGFDILKYDPLNPNEPKNKKSFRAIITTNSQERAGNEGQYIKPFGTRFNSINSGSNVDSNSWVSSYRSFANSFHIAVEGSVKVPNVAAGSQSGSFSEMNSSALGSEYIYYFIKTLRKIHDLELMQTWRGTNGEKYRQKLDGYFKEDVAALPVIKGIPAVDISDMQKNLLLPGGLEQVKNKYLAFIAKYGTHYASRVAWGGQYVSRTETKRSDYEHSRMSEQAFKTSAEATIKKVTVGGSVEWGSSESNNNSNGKSVFRRQTYVQGGNGQTNLDEWDKKVDKAPSPVEITFTPFADLLNKEMFTSDPDIESKSRLLAIFTEKYLVDNMQLPKESRDDFFRPLPDMAMPGDLSVTNSAGLVLRITVTYELNGEWKTEKSTSFSAGMSRNFQIPVDAKSIKLTCEYFTGWLDETKVAFVENFTKPELKCYRVTGTLFGQDHKECEK